MGFDFFKVSEKEAEAKPKKVPEKKPEKDPCPYCGKMYVSVARHLPYCDENPDNQEKEGKEKVASQTEKRDEMDLIRQVREEFQKTLSSEHKEDFALSKEEQAKIEDVIRFLGGTEGYQFIYKSLTGDKIRGSMPFIIDQCIEWLKKHKVYILMNR